MKYFNELKSQTRKNRHYLNFLVPYSCRQDLLFNIFILINIKKLWRKQSIANAIVDLKGHDFLMEAVYISLNCGRFEEKWQIKPADRDGVELVYCKEILHEAAEKASLIFFMNSLLVKAPDSNLIGDYSFYLEKASQIGSLKELIRLKQILKEGHPNSNIVSTNILTDIDNKSKSKQIYFAIYFIGSFLFYLDICLRRLVVTSS